MKIRERLVKLICGSNVCGSLQRGGRRGSSYGLREFCFWERREEVRMNVGGFVGL